MRYEHAPSNPPDMLVGIWLHVVSANPIGLGRSVICAIADWALCFGHPVKREIQDSAEEDAYKPIELLLRNDVSPAQITVLGTSQFDSPLFARFTIRQYPKPVTHI